MHKNLLNRGCWEQKGVVCNRGTRTDKGEEDEGRLVQLQTVPARKESVRKTFGIQGDTRHALVVRDCCTVVTPGPTMRSSVPLPVGTPGSVTSSKASRVKRIVLPISYTSTGVDCRTRIH